MMKKIQARARELKGKDSELKHKDAVKLASKQLRDEGVFKTAKKSTTVKPRTKKKDESELNPKPKPSSMKIQPLFGRSEPKPEPVISNVSTKKTKSKPESISKQKTKRKRITAEDLLSMVD